MGFFEKIKAGLTRTKLSLIHISPGLEIVHASEVVEMCDNPATAFKEKKDSSLTVGLNLLKNGDGAALSLIHI